MSAAAVDLRAFFAAFARQAGAEAGRPLRDGSVLLEWADGRALRWMPRNNGPGVGWPGLRGRLAAKSFTAKTLGPVATRLGESYRQQTVEGINPFEFSGFEDTEVLLSPRRVQEALNSFLAPGVTHWGPMTFAHARSIEGAVALDFKGPRCSVTFSLEPAAPDQDESLARLGCVALGLVHDSRPAGLRAAPDGDLETYLLYALQRTLALGASARLLPDPPRPELELDSLMTDISARFGCKEVLATCLAAAQGGASFVIHSANECTRHYRFVRSARAFQNSSVRRVAMPIASPGAHARIVEMDEMEAVLGNDARVRSALRDASTAPGASLIVGETCVADCIGMPIDGIAEQECADAGKNVSFVRITMDETTPVSQLWASLFRVARRDLPPEPGLVNLVGFGPARSRFADEARSLLQAAGLRLGGMFVPSFEPESASRALCAQVTLVNACALTASEFAEARGLFPEASLRELAPPFGPGATNQFFAEIANACGLQPPQTALQQAWAPLDAPWQALRARAKSHEAAVVASGCDLELLESPGRLHGLALISVLSEMGFPVRLVLRGVPADAAARLRARFPEPGVTLEHRPEHEPLAGLLHGIPSRLVFSAYASDSRVWSAGKAPFRTAQFELGLRGAVRTIARLVRLAECRLPSGGAAP